MTEPDAIPWPLVLAVVVTHNGRRWLPGCLKSLALQSYPALEVMVVDNASEDSEAVPRLVQRLLPTASVLRFERNVGFGAAANRALEVSPDARSAEYYLFIHDDVALDRDCVGLLVASALETDAGVVGGKGLSWDEPEVLLEVGMAADEFGYPVSGLEEGEIDQGQHDTRREVLFVTSACILVSRATVERCGSWDGAYFLFGEDLDLCIRARLCGFPVVVAPRASFHHAVAMATGRREGAPRESIRYFTRRNRLRTIAKNASTARVMLLVALYTGVLGAEVLLLAILRRFQQIPPYLKAYGWFVSSLPDVARRRRAVQRRRNVPDRLVRRYMVRDLPRVRIFLERRLLQWGEETVRLSARTLSHLTPSALAARLGRWSRSPGVLASAAIALLLLVAGRHVLLGAPVGSGSLWPFPAQTHRLLSDYLAGWREIGLGTTGAPAPALPLLWLVGIVSFGNAGLAQKLLVALLLGCGLLGMNRFVKRRSSFVPARVAAVAIYALAPVVRLSLATGALGALALYAFGPFLLEAGLRTLGPVPRAGGVGPPVPRTVDALSRQAVRLALLSAVVVALAPSALVAILALWLVAGLHTALQNGASPSAVRDTLGRLGWLLTSLAAAAVLLVPWSLEALGRSGAILGPVFAGRGGGAALGAAWSQVDLARALLLSPGMSALAGVVTIAVLAGALLVTSESRRREVRLLTSIVVVFGLWAGLVAKGWLAAPVATPALWLVIPLAALAAAGGYLLAGLAEDLPRQAAGWRHPAGAAAAIALAVAALGGWAPTLLSWRTPPPSAVAGTGAEAAALSAVQGAGQGPGQGAGQDSAQGDGDFRVLWVGRRFVDPIRTGLSRQGATPYLVTGADGLSLLDASPPGQGAAGAWLGRSVDAILAGRTHLGGHLLAPAGIRFLIVDRSDAVTVAAVVHQQDLALGQELPQVDIYQNLMSVPVAAAVPQTLEAAAANGSADAAPLLRAQWPQVPEGSTFQRTSQGAFAGKLASPGPHVLLLAEAFSPGWHASVGGKPLQHGQAFGWANRFTVPAGVTGTVRIDHAGEWVRLTWVIAEAGLVLLAVAMATVTRVRGAHRRAPAPSPDPVRPPARPAGRRPGRPVPDWGPQEWGPGPPSPGVGPEWGQEWGPEWGLDAPLAAPVDLPAAPARRGSEGAAGAPRDPANP